MFDKIKPCPEVFILAYAGTSYKEWKMVGMFTKKEYDEKMQTTTLEELAKKLWPSASLVRVFIVNSDTNVSQ